MTLSAVFRWKHPDSTLDMNRRLQTLVPRGIFDGGLVTPGAGLTVNVSTFKALSHDGMVVWDDTVQTIGVTANKVNYICVLAQYVSGTAPTVQWVVRDTASYAADPLRDYLIVFATVDLAAAAVSVTTADISYIPRDAIDPMDRSAFRGTTTDFTTLPAEPPEQNHDGDFYFVLNASGSNPGQTFYYWEDATSSWNVFNSGSYNVETSAMADVLITGERNRIEQGSGVIAGIRPSAGGAADTNITIIETPSVAAQIGFDTFSAVVNGHYVQPYARNITLTAKPVGTRYDLVFLEVWRETIAVPETHTFDRNPDGTLTYSIAQVSDNVEQIQWQAGTGGDNFDLNEIQADDHAWLVTKYRLGSIAGVTAQSLYDNEVAAASGLNIDGNAFAAVPGPTVPGGLAWTADERVWMADSGVTSADGVSWAIPLFVVKRTVAENAGANDAIQEFRSGVRYVFPVHAVTDTANAGMQNLNQTYRQQPSNLNQVYPRDIEPSGFLSTMDYELTGSALTPNAVKLKETGYEGIRVRMRGLEDRVDIESGGVTQVYIGTAPAAGYERSIVYLKMSQTLYANAETAGTNYISTYHRPWFPSDATGGTLLGMGWKRGYVTFELAYTNLGAASSELDEHDAMTAAGWTKGDLALPSPARYDDGGIWSKTVAIDVDDRIHPYLTEWAIPICLVHRRNSGLWTYDTNPNGSTSRPDGHTSAATIYPDDLVDLRHLVGMDSADLRGLLEQDINKVMTGQLRTRLANKWAGAGTGGTVAGSRILQSDDMTAGTPAFQMVPNDANMRKIWSDAREFVPVSESFTMDGDHSGVYVDYNFVGKLITIKAPTGAYICRHLPANYFVDGDSTNATFLDYESSPLLATRVSYNTEDAPWPTPVEAKVIDASGAAVPGQATVEAALVYADGGWLISVSDAYGHATRMTVVDNGTYGANDTCAISFWVHYDRSSTSTYAANYGLAEIPDEVHNVVKDPSGVPSTVNVGTLYAVVRKTIAGLNTVAITSADVAAASGVAGTHTLVGIDWRNIAYSTAPGTATSSITLNAAQTQIDVTWAAPLPNPTEVEFTIFFYTSSVTEWVEIGRGGKSVRGMFTWEDSHTYDWGFGGGNPSTVYSSALGTSTWQNAEVADRFVSMPQIWTSTVGVGGPWTLWEGPSDTTYHVGYEFSNVISITDPSAAVPAQTSLYWKLVYPKWTAPSNAASDSLLINYTYTPYQGLSSTGGFKATPATALTTLKAMLHGEVVESTDHYVTQSGACSVFGGVDGWTGYPARRPNAFLNSHSGRFGGYNHTQLVKETKASGVRDLGMSADPTSMHAAAIMRLPYPFNDAMVASNYHTSTADWDIDPGREGVNSGFFSYAPSYPGAITSYGIAGALTTPHYSQFCNSLARLAVSGEPHEQNASYLLSAAEFQVETAVTDNSLFMTSVPAWKISANSDVMRIVAPIDAKENCIVARTMTALSGAEYNAGLTDDFGGSGILITHPFVDYTNAGNLNNQTIPAAYLDNVDYNTLPNGLQTTLADGPIYLCTAPGTVLAYYAYAMKGVQPNLYIRWTASATGAQTRYVTSSIVTVESPRNFYNDAPALMASTGLDAVGPGYQAGRTVDMIRVAMGSSSAPNAGRISQSGDTYVDSYTSSGHLKGRTIGYPTSWDATTTAAVDAHIQASQIIHNSYGRGIYLGSTTRRLSMPVMVPGSGASLAYTIADAALPTTSAQPPEEYPVGPTSALFAPCNRLWSDFDHGGPLAYACYGLMIAPSTLAYKGQVTFQISGGPTPNNGSVGTKSSVDSLDGTAIDAFWPSKRPIIKNGQ